MKKQEKTFVELCQDRLKKIQEHVVPTHSGHPPLDQLNEGNRRCDELLEFIEVELPSCVFESEMQRIDFYKHTLTSLVAVKIFCRERYYLQINRTGCTANGLKLYYESQLSLLEGFEDRYGFFKGYLRAGMSALDNLYYLPGSGMETVLLPEVSLPNGLAMGCCSYLFSRFKAGKLMRCLLAARILGVEGELSDQMAVNSEALPRKSLTQTMFNLSVDQLGMGARAMLDAAVISGRSFQQVCEDLAPRISTPEKQLVSAGSIRSNAYTGEDIDKHTLIRLLEKMIRLIKEY
ncbi:MAG: RteC domain-containing protein [Bacteroidota bacterium]